MDLGLKGRVAIVAAASKGLGRAVATELAREGAEVAICSRSEKNLADGAARIRSETGREVFSRALDVSDTAAVTASFTRWKRNSGAWIFASPIRVVPQRRNFSKSLPTNGAHPSMICL